MKKLIQFELRKIYTRRLSQLSVIIVLLLSGLLSFSTFQNKYCTDGNQSATGRGAVELDKAIAARYEGTLTDEKVQQMISELIPESTPQGLNVIYIYQNTFQSAVSARFSDQYGNWNGRKVSDMFGEEEIQIGYVDGWLCASQDMAKVILCLSFAVIIMTAPVFCGEYGGIDNIILSSKYGKTKCAAAKAIAAILSALGVTALITAFYLSTTFVMYGREGLDCSILFAPLHAINEYIPFNITCGTLLKYQVLLAFTGTIGVTGITLLLSSVCKNPISALAASTALTVLPMVLPLPESSPLFRLVALLPLYHAQFISLMSIEQIKGDILYAIWAVPTALLLAAAGGCFSHRIFSRHEVA